MDKVFGISGNNFDSSKIKSMADAFYINSEKPEFLSNNNVGLISSTGKKLIYNREHDISLILIGNIFNNSVNINEQILSAYFENDLDFFKNIDGNFLIVLYEHSTEKLTIINDRYGSMPIYYKIESNRIIFSSEVKSILKCDFINKEINWFAWNQLFTFGFLLGNITLFKDVFSLPNASILVFNNGSLHLEKYWTFKDISSIKFKDEDSILKTGSSIVKDLTNKIDSLFTSVQVPLSGGYDSRLIVCALKKFGKSNCNTLTSALHASGKNDSKIALKLANELNLKHFQIIDDHIYEKYFVEMVFFMDGMSFEHLWAMSLKDNLSGDLPLLDGLGADIFLKGKGANIENDVCSSSIDEFSVIDDFCRTKVIDSNEILDYFNIPKNINSLNSDLLLKNLLSNSLKNYKYAVNYFLNRTRNSILLMTNNILNRKCNLVYPFLYNPFVEYSLSIDPKIKIRSNIYFKLLDTIYPSIMKIPSTNNNYIKFTIAKILDSLKFKINKIFSKYVSPDFKIFAINNLPAFPLDKSAIDYLIRLIEDLESPDELDLDTLLKNIKSRLSEKKRVDHLLIPLSNFCIWYNLFYLGKSLEDLKKIK